jgi:hypothetical protein
VQSAGEFEDALHRLRVVRQRPTRGTAHDGRIVRALDPILGQHFLDLHVEKIEQLDVFDLVAAGQRRDDPRGPRLECALDASPRARRDPVDR